MQGNSRRSRPLLEVDNYACCKLKWSIYKDIRTLLIDKAHDPNMTIFTSKTTRTFLGDRKYLLGLCCLETYYYQLYTYYNLTWPNSYWMWVRHRKIAAYSTEFMLPGCLPSAVFLFLYQSGTTCTCTMKVLRKISDLARF